MSYCLFLSYLPHTFEDLGLLGLQLVHLNNFRHHCVPGLVHSRVILRWLENLPYSIADIFSVDSEQGDVGTSSSPE
jgi:hypothetical protein